MRIRVWQAFASNNSGSYTLVGFFRSPADAERAAGALDRVLSAHDAWERAGEEERATQEAPLRAFVREHAGAFAEAIDGEQEDWPYDFAPPPSVASLERQVLVHAPYTVSMPRVLGAIVYTLGGRVETEIVHAHHREIVEFSFWSKLPWEKQTPDGVARQLEALRRELIDEVVGPWLVNPNEHEPRKAVMPVWHLGDWGKQGRLFVVFAKLVEGVRAVRECAARHDVHMRLTITEAHMDADDPIAHLRATAPRDPTKWQVVLWRAGSDHSATARRLRELTASTLDETMALLASLPAAVLDGVSEEEAKRVAEQLTEAGADAQALGPQDFVKR